MTAPDNQVAQIAAKRRFSCCGTQVRRDGKHYADGADDAAAFHVATALNYLERHLPEFPK